RFPLGHLIAVCGVSGSGKTSLIQHTLYPLLAEALGQGGGEQLLPSTTALLGPSKLVNSLEAVRLVSQTPLGRSSRSNIVTYLGIFDAIRQLFAKQELARKYGLSPGFFSFNVAGGRCETCRGLGTVVEDLSFLGEMAVVCPSCQ